MRILFALSLAFSFGLLKTPSLRAETIIAGGLVSADGTLESGFTLDSATLSSSRLSTGVYTITLGRPAGFTGASPSDYLVETSIRSDESGDTLVSVGVQELMNDSLTIRITIRDVEESVIQSRPADDRFNFLVRRADDASIVVDSETKTLLLVASVASDGSAIAHSMIGDGEISTERTGTGEYRITLHEEGAFPEDDPGDYLLFQTPTGTRLYSDSDEGLRGEVDVSSPDSVSFLVRADDLHAYPEPGDHGVPTSTRFSLSVHRIPVDEPARAARSKRLVGLVRFNGDDFRGQSAFPGGVVYGTRTGVGSYVVGFHSVGAFEDVAAARFVPSVFTTSLENTRLVQAEVVVETPHSLVVEIRTYDVESSRGSGGTGEDAAFALLLYDSQRVSSIDATITSKNRRDIWKGRGVYNDSGSGQTLSHRMNSTDPFRFLVAVHHEGNSPESLLLRAGASVGKTVVWYSRMNGTRTNLTALIRSGNLFSSDFRPGEHILIEGNVIPKRGGKFRRSAGWIRSTLAAPDSPADQVGWSLSTPPRKSKP